MRRRFNPFLQAASGLSGFPSARVVDSGYHVLYLLFIFQIFDRFSAKVWQKFNQRGHHRDYRYFVNGGAIYSANIIWKYEIADARQLPL